MESYSLGCVSYSRKRKTSPRIALKDFLEIKRKKSVHVHSSSFSKIRKNDIFKKYFILSWFWWSTLPNMDIMQTQFSLTHKKVYTLHVRYLSTSLSFSVSLNHSHICVHQWDFSALTTLIFILSHSHASYFLCVSVHRIFFSLTHSVFRAKRLTIEL